MIDSNTDYGKAGGKMEHQEYKRFVPNADCAILFIHGIVGTPNHFSDFISTVPDTVSVWNLLLTGHGKQVRDFSHTSMNEWEAQVEDAITHLAQDHTNIYLVAHSMGALLSIEKAIYHREIKGLFLLAAPLKLFIKPQMAINSYKVYRDRIDPEDAVGMAAKKCYGIAPDKNVFHYIGWIPRYLELFAKIRSVRGMLESLSVPCTAYQSQKDEMVSVKSERYLRKCRSVKVVKLKNSRHYYYDEADYKALKEDFKAFVAKIQ
ncbi:MAG: alpha/beta fold hydrolase [Clostridia bacterium]|nr:alpha/beta fold hydrolase [Clostridia bacterium]